MSRRPTGRERTLGSRIAALPLPVWMRAFARLQEIATVLFANELGWFVRAMRLDACVSLRCRTVCAVTHHQCHHHLEVPDSSPERLGAMLEHLGPTFVKLGQVASLRPDFVPLPYAEALRRLQDRAEPMAPAAVERLIAAEAGMAPGEAFASFDPEPIASASLSQVHRAALADGTEVAVKVQRPEVAGLIARDLELIDLMAARLERYSQRARRFHPRRAAVEFASYTRRELDFAREARTMERVRQNMKPEPAVVIPRVHWELTSARLWSWTSSTASGSTTGRGSRRSASTLAGRPSMPPRRCSGRSTSTGSFTRTLIPATSCCSRATASPSSTSACSAASTPGCAGESRRPSSRCAGRSRTGSQRS